jgi:hypothetical protein
MRLLEPWKERQIAQETGEANLAMGGQKFEDNYSFIIHRYKKGSLGLSLSADSPTLVVGEVRSKNENAGCRWWRGHNLSILKPRIPQNSFPFFPHMSDGSSIGVCWGDDEYVGVDTEHCLSVHILNIQRTPRG